MATLATVLRLTGGGVLALGAVGALSGLLMTPATTARAETTTRAAISSGTTADAASMEVAAYLKAGATPVAPVGTAPAAQMGEPQVTLASAAPLTSPKPQAAPTQGSMATLSTSAAPKASRPQPRPVVAHAGATHRAPETIVADASDNAPRIRVNALWSFGALH